MLLRSGSAQRTVSAPVSPMLILLLCSSLSRVTSLEINLEGSGADLRDIHRDRSAGDETGDSPGSAGTSIPHTCRLSSWGLPGGSRLGAGHPLWRRRLAEQHRGRNSGPGAGMEVPLVLCRRGVRQAGGGGLLVPLDRGAGGPDTVTVKVESGNHASCTPKDSMETEPGVFVSRGGGEREIWIATPSDWPPWAHGAQGRPGGSRFGLHPAGPSGGRHPGGRPGYGTVPGRARTLISDNIRTVETRRGGCPGGKIRAGDPGQPPGQPPGGGVLFCAMARMAGHEAAIAAAREDRPPFPYPVWLAPLPGPGGDPGRPQWFEPSPPSPRRAISGGRHPLRASGETPPVSRLLNPARKRTTAGRSGPGPGCRSFHHVHGLPRGLRHGTPGRLGGMPEEDAVLVLSEWFRKSGVHFFPHVLLHLGLPRPFDPRDTGGVGDTGASSETGGSGLPARMVLPGDSEVVVNGEPASGRVLVKDE